MTKKEEEAMKALVQLIGHVSLPTKTEVINVERTSSKKIIIPDSMSKLQASVELERQYEEEESIINLDRAFNNWDWKDTLVAVKRASISYFGWVDAKTVYTMFGPKRPTFIQVLTDIKNGKSVYEEAYHGETSISPWEDAKFQIHVANAASVVVRFELKKKYKEAASSFFDEIEKELKTNSIYRAKSLAIAKSTLGGVEYQIFENKPSDKIFLTEANEMVIADFVIPDLLETGKRAYLFVGDFGTGKTETAMKLGTLANEHKMSFIYLKDSALLDQVILLSQNYSPCVLFLEDVDEVTAGERGHDINHILNTLDGVQSKKADIKMIFTTNNEDKINTAFRRPGRIDQIVKFENPDAITNVKIAKAYLSSFKGYNSLNIEQCVSYFPNAQGAVIAEICKRIARLSTKNGEITENYFISASASIQPQLDLMQKDMRKDTITLDSLFSTLLLSHLDPIYNVIGLTI